MSAVKMRIGEVHTLLRSEYPDIELSKIRYYEEKGLVRPARSRKGYRLYSERDVACLREAFRLAQQEYVPLRVARQRLIEQGLLDDEAAVVAPRAAASPSVNVVSAPVERPVIEMAPALDTDEPVETVEHSAPIVSIVTDDPVAMTGLARLPLRLSRAELLAASSLTSRQLDELVEYGFICPRDAAGRSHYDENDLALSRQVAALVRRGVEVRHLQALKRTVDRQIDLLNDITAPIRQRAAHEGTANVDAQVLEAANELHALRSSMLDRAMRTYLGA